MLIRKVEHSAFEIAPSFPAPAVAARTRSIRFHKSFLFSIRMYKVVHSSQFK